MAAIKTGNAGPASPQPVKPAILIMAASIRAGQSWDLRLPYASLRVTLRVGTQKQPTFMHLLTGLRLQHPQEAKGALTRWRIPFRLRLKTQSQSIRTKLC